MLFWWIEESSFFLSVSFQDLDLLLDLLLESVLLLDLVLESESVLLLDLEWDLDLLLELEVVGLQPWNPRTLKLFVSASHSQPEGSW